MRKVRLLALLLVGVLMSSASGAETRALAEYQGHVVWLDFWASWCGPCRQSFPWMQQMQQRYGQRGLLVVAVNLDRERQEAERFLAGFPHDFAVRFDAAGSLPKQFGVSAMPTSVLLDTRGQVVATHAGFKPSDEAQYEAEIERTLLRSPQ